MVAGPGERIAYMMDPRSGFEDLSDILMEIENLNIPINDLKKLPIEIVEELEKKIPYIGEFLEWYNNIIENVTDFFLPPVGGKVNLRHVSGFRFQSQTYKLYKVIVDEEENVVAYKPLAYNLTDIAILRSDMPQLRFEFDIWVYTQTLYNQNLLIDWMPQERHVIMRQHSYETEYLPETSEYWREEVPCGV